MSLREKILRGSAWNGISQIGAQLINFGLTLVLAHLLSPKDFGLLGMVTVIIGFFGYFSECGLIASLIKKKEIDEIDCNTAFWGGIFLSVFIYIFIYCISPYIVFFYKQPALTSIARALAVAFVIRSYTFVPIALEQRKLQYNKLSIINLMSLLISGTVAIVLAFQGLGVWALVLQQIAMDTAIMLGTLFWMDWKPKFQFSYLRFKSLFGFGFHVTVNNLVNFFSENIDYLLVGKFLGAELLGIYTIAFRLARYPIEKLANILKRILMPAFALMQDDHERIGKNLLRISAFIPFVTVPILVFLFFTTKPFVSLVVGEKWLEAVPLIKIFVIYILLLSFSFADETVLMMGGKIKQLNFVKILTSLILVGAGYLVTKNFGILGMTIVYTVTFSLYYLVLKIMTLKLVQLSVASYIQAMDKIYFYIAILLSTGFLLSFFVEKNEIRSVLYIGGGVFTVALIMTFTYLKVITLRPFKIQFDNCVSVSEHNVLGILSLIFCFATIAFVFMLEPSVKAHDLSMIVNYIIQNILNKIMGG